MTMTSHDHRPHGDHPDHPELARLHTSGWMLGYALRTGQRFARLRLQAFTAGLQAGLTERGPR